jgi:hypothetical protein
MCRTGELWGRETLTHGNEKLHKIDSNQGFDKGHGFSRSRTSELLAAFGYLYLTHH